MNENNEIVAKVCTRCSGVKAIDEFPKDRNRCKVCTKKYQDEYRRDNRERLLDDKKKHYENNKQQFASKNKRYYETHKESRLEYLRKYRVDNKKRIAEEKRKYYEKNKEKVFARMAIWRKENPDLWAMYHQRRRARKQALPDTFTSEELNKTLNIFNGGCALTGETTDYHWDHVIPLATECVGTVFGNMIPLRSDLNNSKRDSNIFEWFYDNKDRFELSEERFEKLIDWLSEVNGMTHEGYRDFVYECHDFNDEEGGVTNDVDNQ